MSEGVKCLLSFFDHTNHVDVSDFEEQFSFLWENCHWILWANITNPDTKLLECPDLCNSITLDWLDNLSSFDIICMGIWKFNSLKVSLRCIPVGKHQEWDNFCKIYITKSLSPKHFKNNNWAKEPKKSNAKTFSSSYFIPVLPIRIIHHTSDRPVIDA